MRMGCWLNKRKEKESKVIWSSSRRLAVLPAGQSSLEVCMASLASWSPQIRQSRCGACESPVATDRCLWSESLFLFASSSSSARFPSFNVNCVFELRLWRLAGAGGA